VTDEGLRAVVAACTQLTSLSLLGCSRVTQVGRAYAHVRIEAAMRVASK
jgi:hypothetical protein